MADAAHEVDSTVMYDGAHVLGLIAGGVFQDPLREGADVMTGSSHKTFTSHKVDFCYLQATMKHSIVANNAMFTGVCSSYHLHHVAGKVVALAEFEAFGKAYVTDIVRNIKVFAESLAAEGFDVLAESRGYTASHQVLTRHGGIDSGAGAVAAQKLEHAGIITNMNMLPGDTKAMNPSGLRLRVQEIIRVGMGINEMAEEVASLYARVLLHDEDPRRVREDVQQLKSDFQHVQYCFDSETIPAYEGM